MHRKDGNHDDITQAFIMCGFVVIDNSQRGPLDLMVYHPRKWHLWNFIEVKNGKYWKLTPDEAKFILDHPERSRIVENAGHVQLIALGKLPNTDTVYAARQTVSKRRTA